jgi:ABC-type amino acid transport substrate-binding protein
MKKSPEQSSAACVRASLRSRRQMSAAVLAVTVLSSLTACGSSSDGGGAEGQLGKVMDAKELTVAVAEFKPFAYQDTNQSWTGYDIDIMRGFAKSLGVKFKVQGMAFDASLQAVTTKRADTTMDISYTKERAKVLSFSRPMLAYKDVLVVNASSPRASSTSNLSGKKIGAISGTVGEGEAKAIPGAKAVVFSQESDLNLAVKQGRVDAGLLNSTSVVAPGLKRLGTVPDSVAPPAEETAGRFGLPKGKYSKALLVKLNAYLKKIACDGTEKKILAKYDLTQPEFLEGICEAPETVSGD